MYADFGCMYAETVGCMYVDFGCIYAETIGCIYADVGCIYADVECKSMERLGASMRMLGASLGVGSSPKLPSGPWPHPPLWFPPKPGTGSWIMGAVPAFWIVSPGAGPGQ